MYLSSKSHHTTGVIKITAFLGFTLLFIFSVHTVLAVDSETSEFRLPSYLSEDDAVEPAKKEIVKFGFQYYCFKTTGSKTSVEFFFQVPYDQLTNTETNPDDGKPAKHVEVGLHYAIIKDEGEKNAEELAHYGQRHRILLDETAVKNKYFLYGYRTLLHPGKYKLIVSVRDFFGSSANVLRQGEREIEMEVPNFDMTNLSLSSVILADEHHEATRRERNQDPLYVKSEYYITPNPSHVFPKDGSLEICFDIYNLATVKRKKSNFKVQYIFFNKQNKIRSNPIIEQGTQPFQIYKIDFTQSKFFVPGYYSVQISVTDEAKEDKRFCFKQVDFTIAP